MGTESTRPTPDAFTYIIIESGCWEWAGYCDPNGYARIYNRESGKVEWAHRWSFQHFKGEIPAGHEIDHTCQNTRCVNPDHLDAVTRAEHVRRTMQRLGKDDLHAAAAHLRGQGLTYGEIADALGYAGAAGAFDAVKSAIAKGLIGADDLPPSTRLTERDCEDIRAMVAFGIPQTVVAAFYGCDSSHISRVSRGLGRSERARRDLITNARRARP